MTILIDLVHVLEYLWGAAWCFFPEADPDAETWVPTTTPTRRTHQPRCAEDPASSTWCWAWVAPATRASFSAVRSKTAIAVRTPSSPAKCLSVNRDTKNLLHWPPPTPSGYIGALPIS